MNTSNQVSEVSEYVLRADKFLNDTNTKFKAVYLRHGIHFVGETKKRDIYKCTLKNKNGSFSFNFGQSISASSHGKDIPTSYDVLACLQKYDVGSIEDFCSEFGYDIYDPNTGRKRKETFKIYNAVCKEYENVCRLFSDEQIELLQEIQ